MKNTVLLIFTVWLPNNFSFAQTDGAELINLFMRQAWDEPLAQFDKLNATEEEYVLENLKFGCEKNNQRPDLKFFRKKDLNHDGRSDFIYTGGCPYLEVSIFQSTEIGHQKVLSNFPGTIVRMREVENGLKVFCFSEACCCIRTNSLCAISFEANKAEISDLQYLIWDKEFELPEQVGNLDTNAIELKRNTILRTNLEINDQKTVDDCSENVYYKGNRIGELLSGARYRVLSVKYDKGGNQWTLIEVLPSPYFIPEPKSVQYTEKTNTILMGWIKK